MSFVDREIVCLDCTQPFVFTAGEQEFYERKGFKEEPKRCKPCRETRKQRRNDAPVTPRAPRAAAAPGPTAGNGGFGFRGNGSVDEQPDSDSLGNRALDDEQDDDIGNRAPAGAARPQAVPAARAANGLARERGGGARERGNGTLLRHGNGGAAGGNGNGGGGERADRRELHDATCAQCGAAARVPFKPVAGRPVYCRDCYASRAASAGGR